VIEHLSLPAPLEVPDRATVLRRATSDDLGAIVRLLADDPVSAGRGDTAATDDVGAYASALDEVIRDPGNDLLVAVDADGSVVATLQLTRIPGMARRGSTRLLVEAVRVASSRRSLGIGGALMRWVVDRAAPELGASLVQLTSDAARVDAHRFYRRLGFVDSHVGFKYRLPTAD
jgi:GNAT superfamily N-acetyltransferase